MNSYLVVIARICLSLTLVASAGCSREPAFPEMIMLEQQPGLSVVSYGQTMTLTGSRLPREYRLLRSHYSVCMTAFENGSAGLGLKALGEGGSELLIESSQPFMDALELNIDFDPKSDYYRYWVLPDWVKADTFRFSVVDDHGHPLGEERIPYSVVRAMKL